MENAEEIFHFLEEFSKRKPKTIPQELNEYLAYVARTGDPVYQWSLVKCLFKEKLLNVITDFYETTPGIDIPPYPNVDPFNYDIMKNSLLERLDAFTSAPFTVQRICELLTFPRKQYNRIDKFMRAIEKNILVVSTREPGAQRHAEPENGDALEPVVNGTDNSEYNVDVEMEDMSWKENAEQRNSEPQPSSSDTHISVDDLEARLQAKQNAPMDTQEKTPTEYESLTPPELNVTADDPISENNTGDPIMLEITPAAEAIKMSESAIASVSPVGMKDEGESKSEISENPALVIPEITVDDADMTEQKLIEQASNTSKIKENIDSSVKVTPEVKVLEEIVIEQPVSADESSSDSNIKEEEPKHISEVVSADESSSDSNIKEEEPKHISEVSTSSEESSSSSDITDGNSNSPKTDESNTDAIHEESNHADIKLQDPVKEVPKIKEEEAPSEEKIDPKPAIESDNYSISDVNSELPQPQADACSKIAKPPSGDAKDIIIEKEKKNEEKAESTVTVANDGDS